MRLKLRPLLLLFTLAIFTGSATSASSLTGDATSAPSSLKIIDHPIFNEKRLELTRDYSKVHYGSATDRLESPKMIVVHYTAIPTLSASLDFFSPTLLFSRDDIKSGGAVNISAHFMVDNNGTVYRLAPDDVICRHTIGFNNVALGIENVGKNKEALTNAQLEADAALIAELAKRHPSIHYLIGHYEYQDRSLPHFALNTELDRSYRPTFKLDPGKRFMSRLRELLKERYHLTFER